MPPNAPGQKRRTPIRIAVIAGILAVLKSALAAPVRALAAGMLALFLVAACGGGGGAAAGPGTETPNPDPELLAPEDSMRLARALSLRNANGGEQAASVFGVPNASHDPAILDVNPFADSAVALAGRRVAARETAAEYKLGNRNFPVPDDSPLLTLAVWIDPAALTSGNGREFLKIQIFISPANLAAFAGDEPGAQIHVIPVTPPVVQPPQPPDPVVAVTLTATAFHPDSPSVTIGETAGRETITVSVSAPVEIGRANGVATLEVTETLLTRITLVGECRPYPGHIKSDGSIAGESAGHDYLGGCGDWDDVFDADEGGNDELYGFSGNDVYRLGRGTDSDIVLEGVFNDWGDPADKILIEADSGGVSVILRRRGKHDLVVELLPPENGGEVRDRLIVEGFYDDDTYRVEILEFASDGSRHNLIWLTRNFAPGDSIALAIPGASPQPPDPVVAVTLTATAFHPDSPSVTIGETAGSETITVSVSAPVEIGRANGVATLEVTETLLTRITLVGECLNFDSLKSDGSIAGKTGVDDYLEGGCDDRDDVFDSDLGGNDELYGFSGNDVYRLGRGTDSDIVLESVFNDWGDPADKILIEADSGGVSVIVRRGENGGDKFSGTYDLVVELLPSEGGEVRDRLIVEDFYYEDTARVEILEFASDGSRHNLIWLTRNFAPGDSIALAIPGASAPSVFYDCEPELDRGTPETDYILGCDNVSDVFDADAGGDDELYGFSGDDVYRLGRGTDSDVIYEGLVYDGDPADKILIEADTEGVSVVLRHDGYPNNFDGYPNNLVVELLPPEGGGEVRDRLIVQNFYYYDAAQVEFLEFASDGSRHNLIALAGNFAEGDSVALAIPGANALSDTDNEDEEQAAQVRNRFAAAFNPGPAFGDAFGKGGKSGASLESRMRAVARSAGFRDGGEDDGFAVWSAENDFGKVWFSPSRRADFGFGAAGRGDVLLGTDSFRNPFAALAGNAMAGGGEWDFRGMRGVGGSARFSAFGDFRLSTGLDGDVRRWADWAVRGVGADDLLNKVRPLAALAQGEARVRGAMGEVRFGDDDGAGVGFQAGALGEADAVLAGTGDEGDGGEGGEGGLRGLRSRTAFAGLSGRTGEWFGWRFRGAAHWGRTSAESSGLLESGLLWSGSYSAGVERSGMFRVGDAFGFRLSQPLRVESGMFRLRGDGVVAGGVGVSAVPSGRQLDAEVLYRVPLRGWGGWSLNAEGWALLSAGWRRHDGHSESSSPQAGALFEAEWDF